MKALKVFGIDQIEMIETTVPKIETSKQVLIHVKAAGICGSDIHLLHGHNPYATYPRIPGHETAGIIEILGEEVQGFKEGDHVVVEPIHTCGKCYPCRIGRPNVCEHLRVYGVHVDGGFGEYMVADAADLHRIPDGISFAQAAMIEPFTIGAQALFRTDARKGDTCLIHGAGPIGAITLTLAKHGGLRCLVSEPSAARRRMAKELGAEVYVDPMAEDLTKAVQDFTDGRGMNIIFDAVGLPSLIAQSIPMLSAAGRFLEFGYGFGKAEIDFNLVNKNELTLLGSRHQTYRFEPVIAHFKEYLPEVNRMQTHLFSLDQFNEAFAAFEDKRSGACKVAFVFE